MPNEFFLSEMNLKLKGFRRLRKNTEIWAMPKWALRLKISWRSLILELVVERKEIMWSLSRNLKLTSRSIKNKLPVRINMYNNLNEVTVPVSDITSMSSLNNENSKESSVRQRSIASLVQKEDIEPTGYVGKVVRAANMLDYLTSVIGLYLRRNPLLRMSTLLYLVFLHLYVFFVLGLWTSSIPTDKKL